MKNFKPLLIALLLSCCTAPLFSQKIFNGSIKFKNYPSNSYITQTLYDSITYSYCSNGVYVEHKINRDPSFNSPETAVQTDTAIYLFYRVHPNSIQEMKTPMQYVQSATATNEYQIILNHRCQKYVVNRIFEDTITITSNWWIAEDMKLSGNFKQMLKENSGCPLKYETFNIGKDGKLAYISIVEAIEINESSIPFDLANFLKGKTITQYDRYGMKRKRSR